MKMVNLTVYPKLTASIGGAQSVEWTKRYAWITAADGVRHRIARSKLPPIDQWTAFILADAVDPDIKKQAEGDGQPIRRRMSHV